MSSILTRDEAIERIWARDLAALSGEERQEQLECMACEDWESDPAWASLDKDLREEIESAEEFEDAKDPRYDAVLLIWLRTEYRAVRSEGLLRRLTDMGHECAEVTGDAATRIPCPCCGYCTLGARGDYHVCRVCWWEDDGQDNEDAGEVRGGPNHQVSLTAGRINFLTVGIYDPEREDLRPLQKPRDDFAIGRRFELTADNTGVRERELE